MGNTHNKQRNQFIHKEQQQHHQQTNLVLSSSRSLFPILCSRNSINDIIAQPSINITDEEPMSPKVGCMGQLKMTHNNNKRSNRVSTNHLPLHNNINTKKIKLFSGKNLVLSSATTASTSIKTTGIRSNSWVGPRSSTTITNPVISSQNQFSFIREMDPPLPVVVNKPGEEGGYVESRSSVLWKRRFGEVSCLETLDLNRLNIIHSSPPPEPLSV